jgi:hypothetical protein
MNMTWIYNKVKVKGGWNDLARLKTLLNSDSGCFDFNRIVPIPKSQKCALLGRDYDLERLKNRLWGCDRSPVNASFRQRGKELTYQFRTAGYVPFPVCAKLFRMFPQLQIDWLSCNEDDWRGWGSEERFDSVSDFVRRHANELLA